MSVHIRNISNGLVSVELNSGDTIHLAPGERSGVVEKYDISDNPWVRTLHEQGRVALDSPVAETGRGRERRRAKNDEESPASND